MCHGRNRENRRIGEGRDGSDHSLKHQPEKKIILCVNLVGSTCPCASGGVERQGDILPQGKMAVCAKEGILVSGGTALRKMSRYEKQCRTTWLVEQSTGKEFAKGPPHVVVKWSPTCLLHRVQKRGWWRRGYGSTTVFGGQKKSIKSENIPFWVQNSVPHYCGDVIFALSS